MPDDGEPARVLVVCTANVIRSPFVAGLLRTRLETAGVTGLRLDSAGVSARPGRPAETRVRDLGRVYGLDLDAHRSALLDDARLASGPTVLCAERGHRRAILALRPDLVASVFTIREFARLVEAVGREGEPAPREWSELVQRAARARFADRHVVDSDDDVVDPIGRSDDVWLQFENQATQAVSTILAAIRALPAIVAPTELGRLTTRREYRRMRDRSARGVSLLD